MKNLFVRPGFFSVFALLFVLSIGSCKKDKPEDDTTPLNSTLWGNVKQVAISGQVLDESGQPLSGVNVQAGVSTVTTDENGVFYISKASVFEKLGYVKASKPGYFTGSRTFLPGDGTKAMKIRMLRKDIAGSISASTGGNVQLEGLQIIFTGGSFVQDNAAFSGQVNVVLNYIDPESEHFDSEMPGTLLGMKGETPLSMISYGMVAVELIDNNGKKVALAPGKSAEMRFPLSPGLQADAPSQIDLWYFDESKGLWIQEGTASLENNKYVAQVTHFTFWNCDIGVPSIMLQGQVTTEDTCFGIGGARVTIRRGSESGISDYTNASGYFGGYVPAGTALSISIAIKCGDTGDFKEVYKRTIGPYTTATGLLCPALSVSSDTLTRVNGTITDCQHKPLANAYIVASGQAYFPDSKGQFSLLTCRGGSLTLKSFGASPWAMGATAIVSLNAPIVSAGELKICGDTGPVTGTVTDIDGHVYPTVTIGSQIWMAANLNTKHYADGSEIPNEPDSSIWAGLTMGAWRYYRNNPELEGTYGKLYNWYTVVDPRNACPAGWHAPSDSEWTTLSDFLGGEEVAGGKMKSVIGWNAPNTGATNESGFTGLPGGALVPGGFGIEPLGHEGYWWTTTEGDNDASYNRILHADQSYISRYNYYRHSAHSVRCVKD